jgi:hypothetical protein
MDRVSVVALLRDQPHGTFVCRVSFSQPGSLIVSCRLPTAHSQADGDGMLHLVVGAAQLRQRRVDSWLRGLPGASHVLDVYSGARVDKRQVLESDYVRLQAIVPGAPAPVAGDDGAGGGGGAGKGAPAGAPPALVLAAGAV